jgi:hypothetical protein
MGEAIDGFMYGSNRLNKILFYWHPDVGIQYFFKLEANEKLLNMAPHPEGGVLALTVEILDQSNLGKETYRVSHINAFLIAANDFLLEVVWTKIRNV